MILFIKKALIIVLKYLLFFVLSIFISIIAVIIIQVIQIFNLSSKSQINLLIKDDLCIDQNLLYPNLIEIKGEGVETSYNKNIISNTICFTFKNYKYYEDNTISITSPYLKLLNKNIKIYIKDLPKIIEIKQESNIFKINFDESIDKYNFSLLGNETINKCSTNNDSINCQYPNFSTSSSLYEIKYNYQDKIAGVLINGLLTTNLKDQIIYHNHFNGICGRKSYINKCVLGFTREGREINLVKIGNAQKTIFLFASIHGDEQNTAVLMNEIVQKIERKELLVPYDVQLLIVPIINPDGYARDYRFTSNNVDLNRNFDVENWQKYTYLTDDVEFSHAGGEYPFSEPESLLISNLILFTQPELSISYHSWGKSVTSAGDDISNYYTRIYSNNSGYAYFDNDSNESGFNYVITGDFNQWMYQEGYPALTVELWDTDNSDIERNVDPLEKILNEIEKIN